MWNHRILEIFENSSFICGNSIAFFGNNTVVQEFLLLSAVLVELHSCTLRPNFEGTWDSLVHGETPGARTASSRLFLKWLWLSGSGLELSRWLGSCLLGLSISGRGEENFSGVPFENWTQLCSSPCENFVKLLGNRCSSVSWDHMPWCVR